MGKVEELELILKEQRESSPGYLTINLPSGLMEQLLAVVRAADELADADDKLTQLIQDASFAKGPDKRAVNKQIEDAQRECVAAWVKYRAARGKVCG